MPTKKATHVQMSIDLDKLIRDEATDWLTSNRTGLETVVHRVADRVREEIEAYWIAENSALRDRVRELEEDVKRLRSVLTMVRSQVVEEATVRD